MTESAKHSGKMNRGKMWYNQRDRDGTIPEGIANDPEKMKDVNYFIENNKPKEEPKPVSKKKEKEK